MNYNYFTGKSLDMMEELDGGLYLVGTCIFNPVNEEEKYYWIKVGQTEHFGKRLKQYNTHNPMLWKGDFFICSSKRTRDSLENHCHYILNQEAVGSMSICSEWYEVPKEIYLKICEEGFSFFKNHPCYNKMGTSLKPLFEQMWEMAQLF